MEDINSIDLNFRNVKQSIGAYLVETSVGPVLIESGPAATWDHLVAGLKQHQYTPSDIKHVLLTHIHFDHAGAAWKFAALGAKIYVHPKGLPHLENPEKLWNSAKLIYGDQMEVLWGTMEGISVENLVGVDQGDVIQIGNTSFITHYTPGHAVHHNAYQMGDYIFTGDVAGVKIGPGPIVPPCPPPDINIELWKSSIEKIRNLKPKGLFLTHFELHTNVEELLNELIEELDAWVNFIRPFYESKTEAAQIVPKFMEFTKTNFLNKGVSEKDIEVYEFANPSWMSVNGLLRYLKLKEQGRI